MAERRGVREREKERGKRDFTAGAAVILRSRAPGGYCYCCCTHVCIAALAYEIQRYTRGIPRPIWAFIFRSNFRKRRETCQRRRLFFFRLRDKTDGTIIRGLCHLRPAAFRRVMPRGIVSRHPPVGICITPAFAPKYRVLPVARSLGLGLCFVVVGLDFTWGGKRDGRERCRACL